VKARGHGQHKQQRACPCHQQQGSRPVEFLPRAELPGARQQIAARDDRRDTDGHVHPVHGAPSDRRGEQAAQGGAEREPDGLRARLDSESEAHPVLRRARRHQGHAVGLEHRGSGGLDETQAHQDTEGGCQAAGRRGHREHGKAVGVHEFAAGRVAEPPGRGKHGDQSEQVNERHPLDLGDRDAKGVLHRRERDRDDTRVQLAHERTEADHAHGEPRCPPALPDDGGSRQLVQNTSVTEHLGTRLSDNSVSEHLKPRSEDLTPDMPSAVLALAFLTRQTHGGGSGPRPSGRPLR